MRWGLAIGGGLLLAVLVATNPAPAAFSSQILAPLAADLDGRLYQQFLEQKADAATLTGWDRFAYWWWTGDTVKASLQRQQEGFQVARRQILPGLQERSRRQTFGLFSIYTLPCGGADEDTYLGVLGTFWQITVVCQKKQ